MNELIADEFAKRRGSRSRVVNYQVRNKHNKYTYILLLDCVTSLLYVINIILHFPFQIIFTYELWQLVLDSIHLSE